MPQAERTPSTPALRHNPDAELIHLVERVMATWRTREETVPDVVDIPPEIDAELRRLMAVETAYARRAAALRALTPVRVAVAAGAAVDLEKLRAVATSWHDETARLLA